MGRISELAHDGSGSEMTLCVENVVDGCMDEEKSLGRALTFETLHFTFSTPDWQVGIFAPVVLAHSSGMVPLAQVEIECGGTVGTQTIRHDALRMHARILQRLAHQPARSPLVAALLHQYVEDLAFVVDCPPQIHPCPANADHHFVQMPTRRGLRSRTAKLLRDASAELECPASNRFVTDLDAALGEQILDIPQAQREPKIKPDRMADHVNGKAVAIV